MTVLGLVALAAMMGGMLGESAAARDAAADQRATVHRDREFHRGYSYLKWGHQFEEQSESELKALAALGVTHVSIVPLWYQDGKHSTQIGPHPALSPTQAELRTALLNAKAAGLKILLKPHVDVIHEMWPEERGRSRAAWLEKKRELQRSYPVPRPFLSGSRQRDLSWFDQLFPAWRGEIEPVVDPGDSEGAAAWLDQWFASYEHFILTHARLGREIGIDFFCVGTEFERLQRHDMRWRRIIAAVRGVFEGTSTRLIYDANWSSYDEVPFWEALDGIGISAYFSLTNKMDPTLDEIRRGWRTHLDRMERWRADRHPDKTVYFSEAGFASLDGAAKMPWDFKRYAKIDEEEQAECIRGTILEVERRPWLGGVYFWRWTMESDPTFNYDFFTSFGKPAMDVIREFWGRGR